MPGTTTNRRRTGGLVQRCGYHVITLYCSRFSVCLVLRAFRVRHLVPCLRDSIREIRRVPLVTPTKKNIEITRGASFCYCRCELLGGLFVVQEKKRLHYGACTIRRVSPHEIVVAVWRGGGAPQQWKDATRSTVGAEREKIQDGVR